MKHLAVIGCGGWGQNLVRTTHELGFLAAICDTDAERAKKFSDTYQVPAKSYDEILADASVTGVILPVPAPLHAKMALQAIAAGKHVFVEKPIAMNVDDAQSMVDAAKKADRVLMVGHVLQYHAAFVALTKLVADGALGDLRHIRSNRLNFGKVRVEENVFWSFAPHDVSMMLALAGREPVSVQAHYAADLPQSDLAASASAHFDFGKGLKGEIHVSWLNPFKEQKLTVVGTKGMAVFDDTAASEKKLALYANSVDFKDGQPVMNKAEPQYIALPNCQPLTCEISHFAECVAQNRAPRTDGNEGVRVLKVMQQCDKTAGI